MGHIDPGQSQGEPGQRMIRVSSPGIIAQSSPPSLQHQDTLTLSPVWRPRELARATTIYHFLPSGGFICYTRSISSNRTRCLSGKLMNTERRPGDPNIPHHENNGETEGLQLSTVHSQCPQSVSRRNYNLNPGRGSFNGWSEPSLGIECDLMMREEERTHH